MGAQRGARVVATAVTMAASEDALPEDVAPPPPPPPVPSTPSSTTAPSPPTAAAVAAAAPTSATSSTSSFGPAQPGLPGLTGLAGGVGRGGASGSPLSSTTPTATAAPQPTMQPARVLQRTPPRFPSGARRDGVTGRVVLHLHVDASGVVVDARVLESEPAGTFDAAALEAVRTWTFRPATSDGRPVDSWVRQTIRFALESP
jgi:protein TonB